MSTVVIYRWTDPASCTMTDLGMNRGILATGPPDPIEAENVLYNPTLAELRAYSEHLETTTEYGSPAYVSEYRSRSAERTKNAIDDEFDETDHALVSDAVQSVENHEHEMVCLDRRVGRHPDHSYVCRYYVPKAYSRIALAWAKLFEPVREGDGDGVVDPDFVTIQLPDWEETEIRVLPDEGLTVVLGSDYTGEAKKSFLRLFMYRVKQAGGLGLHAGSKRVRITDDSGESRTVGQLFLGLSATGKSTLTGHGFDLSPPDAAEMLQDDVCALLPDGTVAGSEGNGLYVKTIGLDPDEQAAIYSAATHESAVLENVAVDHDGTVDFDDDELTRNGRAVVDRTHLESASDDLDLDHVDQIFFITRNPLMPPIARLSAEEAAAAFMLGESIQTSAGDPDRAGEAIRVVGTNPFIVGSEGEEGNRFRDLVADLDVECFVINTGQVGDEVTRDVGVEDTVTILREVARGTVEWTHDETIDLTIPASVPGLPVEEYYVPDYVDDYDRKARELREDRRAYLEGFEELRSEIARAVY
jgi:phosphoenolpyruvate carboxykinase (ATP)